LVKWSKLIGEFRASDKSFIADTAASRQRIFDFRHKLPQLINEFLRAHGQVKAALDCAVSDHNFPRMYEFCKQKGQESGIDYLNFGHIGQDHLHFNFLPRNDQEADKAKKFMLEICAKAVEFGGTISAEHGIGKRKKEYLKLMFSQKDIDQMKKLKKYFDSGWLLGQGNIFDK
jgi:D-lactate dehydrogenase (cytochrome)